jgi:hypothetical protein
MKRESSTREGRTQMAIADDDLHERIRQQVPVNDEQPPDEASEPCRSILATGRTPAAPVPHRSRWAAIAGIGAVASVVVAGFAVWPSGGEPSAAALVRDAVEALDDINSYSAIGEEVEPGVRNESWSILVDGDDAAFTSRVVADGRFEESAVTYLGDAVYVTAQGQTETRSRAPAGGIDTRYHDLLAALTSALDGADVTEASTETVAGVEMTRYYVGLTEQSIASLSGGGTVDLIADPEDLEELRVCVADAHHVHEIHFVYRDGRTIDVTLVSVNGDITIRPPDSA